MGKKSNDAPDYTPLANASDAAAEKMAKLTKKDETEVKVKTEVASK